MSKVSNYVFRIGSMIGRREESGLEVGCPRGPTHARRVAFAGMRVDEGGECGFEIGIGDVDEGGDKEDGVWECLKVAIFSVYAPNCRLRRKAHHIRRKMKP